MTDPFQPIASPDSEDFAIAVTAQAAASDPAQSAWVAANAGSGKTKVLIDRVARLLLNGAAPDSILCITYTRAAANEMIGRLFKRLGDWSVSAAAQLAEELGALQGRPARSFSAAELRQARALFARALETPGGLRIETIHAFCGRVLRRFPLEAGVAPGFRELEDSESLRLWRSARDAALLELAQTDPDTLDSIARSAGNAGAVSAASLIRASRGLSDYLREDGGARLRQALRAPDTDSHAILKRGVIEDLPMEDYQLAIGALRSGSERDRMRADSLASALETSDVDHRFGTLRRLFRTAQNTLAASNPYTKAAAKAWPGLEAMLQIKAGEGHEISRLKAVERDWMAICAVERTEQLMALATPLVTGFESAKRRRGALDFDDLISATRTLLTDQGMAQWVLYKLDGQLSHVLLDEAQDTSPDQWALINAVTDEFHAGLGTATDEAPRTQFVVGDTKQSIYSFQGADPDSFLLERQRFVSRTQGQGATPDMAMSFRSSPEILSFVDTVFSTGGFDGHPFSTLPPGDADLLRHTARRANQPGCVSLAPVGEPPPETDAKPWDAPIDMLADRSPKAQLAKSVADWIVSLLARGETIWEEGPNQRWRRRVATPGDILILVRKRSNLFEALIQELKRADLPVAGADRLILSQHIGVQDCLNLMRFALAPDDDLTLAEILRGPFCDLVDDDSVLFPLAYDRGETSLWTRLCAADQDEFDDAKRFLSHILAHKHAAPFEFLSLILDQPVLGEETGWDRLGARLGVTARDPVEALLGRALAHDTERGGALQTFVTALEGDLSDIKRDLAEPDGAIRIMTVHGAKGLQAPIVILPDTTSAPQARLDGWLTLSDGERVWAGGRDMETDELAAARAEAEARAIREHNRLLYVALTRAQDRLHICGHWHGRSGGDGYDPRSWFAYCSAAMAHLGGSETDAGVQQFGQQAPCAPPKPARNADKFTTPDWLRQSAPATAHGLRTLSPSELITDTSLTINPLAPKGLDRRRRGRLIHALLERLPRLPNHEREQAGRAFLRQAQGLDPQALQDILSTTITTLDTPEMAEVFSADGREEVAIIGAGTGWPQGTLINGRVDRLIVSPDRVLIVDIKTDRPPPQHVEGVEPTYLAQMGAYANVLETRFPDRRIDCAIVWTDGPRLMPLPNHLLLAALNRAQSSL